MLKEKYGIEAQRDDIKINVFGINHFTWVNEAHFKDMDLMPMYDEYVKDHPDGTEDEWEDDWIHLPDKNTSQVKFDLYRRYNVIAAAGDRHLAEFCPGNWYLKDKETVEKFGFALTSVKWRIDVFTKEKEDKTKELLEGKPFELYDSGEEMVVQIKALLGLGDFVTNVNMPNKGQIPNLPYDAVVETNAYFSGDSIKPIFAGEMPLKISNLVLPTISEQEAVVEAGLTGDYDLAFSAFVNSPNMTAPLDKAREMFDRMLYNTRKYLPFYDKYAQSKKK
jgi:alpha-galactosidase